MDFFDSHYYSLTRRLLLLLGLWPDQDQTTKIARCISITCITMSMSFVQTYVFTIHNRLVVSPQMKITYAATWKSLPAIFELSNSEKIAKLMTAKLTMNLIVEILSIEIVGTICMIKYFTYSMQTKKVKILLQCIENDWNGLTDADDRKIADKYAENGRKYNFFCMVYLYSSVIVCTIIFGSQPLIEKLYPRNETYEKVTIYQAEYFVDTDEYFYPILLHMSFTLTVFLTILIATDALYVTFLYHAYGMFKVLSNRLVHAFDTYEENGISSEEKKNETRVKIINAVEFHNSVTEYADYVTSSFQVSMFLQCWLVFLNIVLTLYCAAVSLNKITELVASLLLVFCQMIQALIIAYPSQNVADSSSAILFDTYCGQWYMAPSKSQMLILPILQRASKPTVISASKLVQFTLQHYAVALQGSLSYFTVLLSFR